MKLIALPIVLIIITVLAGCVDKSPGLIEPYFFDQDCLIEAPDSLEGLSEGCYLTLFEDSFFSNINDWILDEDDDRFFHTIDDGQLIVETDQDESLLWGLSQEISGWMEIANFELSVAFRIAKTISGNEERYSSITWGADEGIDNFQNFRFNSENIFEFYESENGNNTSHVAGTFLSAPFTDPNFVDVTVRSYDSQCYLFLNSALVLQMPQKKLFGNKLFIGAGGGNEIWIDKIKISRLP